MAGDEEHKSQHQLVQGSATSRATAPWENSTHPLFIHHSDQPGVMLVSEPLAEDNYSIWAPTIMMALEIKNKAGFVNGTLKRSQINKEEALQWDRCNTLVKNLLISSMTKTMSKSVIHRNIHNCEQGGRSVTTYYTDLKGMWDEKDVLYSFPSCTCDAAAEINKFMEA
ncbi:uncharacterized protein LOC112170616 [Rosa chinensis]|uniref:uncharacterized protein LOC112170616 n=1 Tax=Rosa chinensis TaxID=74649 RepID=UPI000D08C849|nr:uncharacterized protein LOC112170616 [Rosa chinensis]